MNYAATKFATMSVPALPIVAFRFVVGGLLMYGVLRVLEPGSRLRRGDLLSMAGLGCLGIAVGQTAYTFGLSLTTAANTGLIFATAPVWGLLLDLVLGLERPSLMGTLGVGLSITGVGIVFHEGLGAEGASPSGDLCELLAAIGFGAYTVLSMRMLKSYSPLAVATYPTLFGSGCRTGRRGGDGWEDRPELGQDARPDPGGERHQDLRQKKSKKSTTTRADSPYRSLCTIRAIFVPRTAVACSL